MTAKIINTPLIRSVAFAAAIIGTIQAAIWVSLSLISILLYYSVIEIDVNLSPHNYLHILYDIFIDPDYTNEDVIVTTKVFNIFMYVYVASSFAWLIVSLYMMWAMKRNKWNGNSVVIGLWSGITILISILDIVMISLVVADYIVIQDSFNQSNTPEVPTYAPPTTIIPPTEPSIPDNVTIIPPIPSEPITDSPLTITPEATTDLPLTTTPEAITDSPFTTTPDATTDSGTTIEEATTTNAPAQNSPELMINKSLSGLNLVDTSIFQDLSQDGLWRQLINTSYIIVMTLAARGYILWIINVVLAIILIKFAIDMKKQKTPSLLPMIDGYSTGRPPWSNNLYEQTDIGNGYSNGGFTDDNDKAMFPRSDSFVTTTESENVNQNPLGNGQNPYAQQIEKLRPVSDNPNIVSPKVAKIGKQNGRRTPPRNVPPPNIPQSNSPYIPDPDYSPPGSPLKPKSVLRPRSNYVL